MRWVVVLGLVSGCGRGAGGLDCQWLASQNCWKTALAELAACGVPENATGTLSADRRVCSYTDGHEVDFDAPAVLPPSQANTYSLTVKRAGTQCARFDEPSTSDYGLTTASGTVHVVSSASSVSITCPDQTVYSNKNPLSLLNCSFDGGSVVEHFPGLVYQSAGGLDLGGGGAGASKQVSLFLCQ